MNILERQESIRSVMKKRDTGIFALEDLKAEKEEIPQGLADHVSSFYNIHWDNTSVPCHLTFDEYLEGYIEDRLMGGHWDLDEAEFIERKG